MNGVIIKISKNITLSIDINNIYIYICIRKLINLNKTKMKTQEKLVNICKAVENTSIHLAQFYFEWGNEGVGRVSIGRYNDKGEYKSMGTIEKTKVLHLVKHCPYN